MRILFVGDAPTVSTGFSLITRKVCGCLATLGHEIVVLGRNYFGQPHTYPYPIYPCIDPIALYRDPFGVQRLPQLMYETRPDIVVLLTDAWDIRGYLDGIRAWEFRSNILLDQIPVVGWVAVDSLNTECDFAGLSDSREPSIVGNAASYLSHLMTWTEFARDELIRNGYRGSSSVVPLGVDRNIFYPRDKRESRALFRGAQLADDAFVVGYVGRNQYRKRLDLLIRYFAAFVRGGSDYVRNKAILCIHSAPSGENSIDIRSLARHYGLTGRVHLAEPERGNGLNESLMPYVYSAMDVFLTCSQAEGWDLPLLEAMSCGVPAIANDWSGHDWARSAACLIPCTSTALTAPFGGAMRTIGGVMDEEATTDALRRLHFSWQLKRNVGHSIGRVLWYDELFRKGIELAESLTWQKTCEGVLEAITSVVGARRRVSKVTI